MDSSASDTVATIRRVGLPAWLEQLQTLAK